MAERKIAFYIRVSTDRQAKVQEGSLKNQKQILLAELQKRNLQTSGWGELIETYVDEGISGKDTNRPAFQKMMKDIEIGRINAVMFTELSRLSRSLKDFLNIFEFVQKFDCDLICLKTDIDTTSPYKNMITKILMVFGEFEREMTSERTSINAYERSRRGLANGGIVPAGYRRDKNRKGYLIIDEPGAEAVREIFRTYIAEKSIKKTMERIRRKYEGKVIGLKKIARSKVHSILTNKAYIGIREIYKKDKSKTEEVKAVWEAIVDEKIFRQAEALLKKNSELLGRIRSTNFIYLLSGLMICGKCGERFQGKSAYSSTHKKHYYYSHMRTCKANGINRIPAGEAHSLVLDWLRDISSNGKKFAELKEQGKARIRVQIKTLEKECTSLTHEADTLTEEIEARVSKLVRTRAEAVKKAIEDSITKLEARKAENAGKRLYVENELKTLREMIVNDKGLFEEYRKPIISTLKSDSGKELQNRLREILAFVRIEEKDIKIALRGVNLKGPVRAPSVTAPRAGQTANNPLDWQFLIQENIPLPGHLLLKNNSYISSLRIKHKLTMREIARRLHTSHSAVIQALNRAGISRTLPASPDHRKGQIPFGFDCIDFKLVKNMQEQEAIRIIRQMKLTGLSLRACAREMNKRLIPAKNNGIWQANTVKKILERAG